jgi:hypothetical protein
MEPSWSKGLSLPKSMTKPMFPELVTKVTVVPTERFVGLGVWGARFRGGGTASAAPDIDGARRGSGAASVGLSANACEIGPGANVILDSIFGFLANDETSEEKRQAEQTDESREITINLHWTPHVVQMGIESPVRQKAKL